MRANLVDGMVVTAVAAATALFLGAGGPLVRAGGENGSSEPRAAAAVELGGCELSAVAAAGLSGRENVVTIRAKNRRSSAAELRLLVRVERRDLRPEAAMRRVIQEKDFVTTKVAEKEVSLAVRSGADAETIVRLAALPAGTYTIAASLAGGDAKTVALASLNVAAPRADTPREEGSTPVGEAG